MAPHVTVQPSVRNDSIQLTSHLAAIVFAQPEHKNPDTRTESFNLLPFPRTKSTRMIHE